MATEQTSAVKPAAAVGLVLMSATLMAFVGLWESGSTRVLTVYADQLAGGLPTVCHGLTRHVTDTPIIVGDVWTDAQCESEEQAAMLRRVQAPLLRCFQHVPPQSVLDAASSHAWNFGVGKTCGSEAMRAWNRGDWDHGCRLIYVTDDGRPNWSSTCNYDMDPPCKFVRGLQNRRQAEYRMCMRDVLEAT
jgi:lysozyme